METKTNSTESIGFYSNVCHVCRAYGKDIKLKRCGNCVAIAYCSKEHQVKHWRQHKYFCRVISKLIKDADTDSKMDSYSKNPKESWAMARTKLILDVQTQLGYEFSPFELDMLMYPRCCEICHETDASKLNDCPECPSTSFCIEHSKENSNHSTRCERLKFCFETSVASSNPLDIPIALNYGESLPNNMDQMIDFYSSHCPMDKIFSSRKIWAALVSNELTRPYTFLYSMKKLSRPKLAKMTIHVVGSARKEVVNVHLWERLFHHEESLKELKIVLVGPALLTACATIQLCDSCRKAKRKIDIQTAGDLYADFAARNTFTKPDYVIGFHLGIGASSMACDTWGPTFDVLAQLGCPFSMTSYCADEWEADKERINTAFEKKVEFQWAGRNPFCGLKPGRDFECNDFYYSNQYLTIYEKLP